MANPTNPETTRLTNRGSSLEPAWGRELTLASAGATWGAGVTGVSISWPPPTLIGWAGIKSTTGAGAGCGAGVGCGAGAGCGVGVTITSGVVAPPVPPTVELVGIAQALVPPCSDANILPG